MPSVFDTLSGKPPADKPKVVSVFDFEQVPDGAVASEEIPLYGTRDILMRYSEMEGLHRWVDALVKPDGRRFLWAWDHAAFLDQEEAAEWLKSLG